MKKNQTPMKNYPRQTLAIQDYGHDRTVHSLGRAGRSTRQRALARLRMIVLGGCIVLLLLTSACLFWPFMPWQKVSAPSQTTANTSSLATTQTSEATTTASTTAATAITPSATSVLSAAERAARLSQAGSDITALLKSKKGRFGICYHNLQHDETWQYQADQPFVAASSIKIGIMTCLYSQIAAGKVSFDDMLTYDSREYPTGDYEGGTGTIKGMPNGTTLTVRETARLAIRISDNCGTNMIIRHLDGIDTINTFLKEISHVVDYRLRLTYTNYAGQIYENGRHRTSATDLAAYTAKLYQLWQENPAIYDPLMDDLSNTEFDFGIQKGVPSTVRVAHKIGTNGTYSTENDVGIVFASEPYVLCVMTEMASAEAARKVQADVSKIIYEFIEGLSQP
jgi:beta-lactamase class A